MAIKLNYLIVDGVFYDAVPSQFSQMTEDRFGVATTVYHIADGGRIAAAQAMPIGDYGDYRDYLHRRKIAVQAWRIDWSEESLLDVAMAHHLLSLYETQRPFWFQYDDEQSRCWGRLIGLTADIADGGKPHAYFTPHYPVFPYGHEPPDDPDAVGAWDDSLWIANDLWPGEYTVYPDYGLVLLPADGRCLSDRLKVHLKYTWRAYVRVREISVKPYQIAQRHYTGSAVLEQIAVPVGGVEIAWRTEPYLGTCVYVPYAATVVNGRVMVAASVAGAAVGHVVDDAKVAARLQVAARAVAQKDAAAQRYGSPNLAQVSLGATAAGVSTAPSKRRILTESSSGTGWAPSTGSKTAAEILGDSDATTYVSGSTFSQVFDLAAADDPGVHTGHTFSVAWQRGTPASTVLTVRLLEGSREIVAKAFTRSSNGSAVDVYTLSESEAGHIVDYTALKVRFYASLLALVSGFELEIPLFGEIAVKFGQAVARVGLEAEAHPYRAYVYGQPSMAQVALVAKAVGFSVVPELPPEEPGG